MLFDGWRRLPLALILGVVVGLVAHLLSVVVIAMAPEQQSLHVTLLSMGLRFVALTLLGVGFWELAERFAGTTRRLLQIVAWVQASRALWLVSQHAVFDLWVRHRGPMEGNTFITWYGMIFLTFVVIELTGIVLATVASRSWTRAPATCALAIGALVARDAMTAVPSLGAWAFEHRELSALIGLALALVSLVAVAAIACDVVRATPEAEPSEPPAVRASVSLRFAGWALYWRLFLLFGLISDATTGVFGAYRLPVSLGFALLSTLAFVWGIWRTAGTSLPDLPRGQLMLGGALVTWSAGVQSAQLYAQARALVGDAYPMTQWIAPFTVAAPAVAAIGLALVIHALSRYAAARGNEKLRTFALMHGSLFVVLMGVAIGGLAEGSERIPMIVSTLAGLGGFFVVSLTCTEASRQITGAQSLPTATARR